MLLTASLERITSKHHIGGIEYGYLPSSDKETTQKHEKDTNLALSVLWSTDGASKVLKWSLEKSHNFFETKVLLKNLCGQGVDKGGGEQESIQVQGEEAEEAAMRAMRIAKELAGSSQRQELVEQLSGKLADSLRILSQHIALEGQEGSYKLVLNADLYRRKSMVCHLKDLSRKWATPTTMDTLPPKSAEALEREATVSRPGRSKPANLRDQVSNVDNWPTPTCNMVSGGANHNSPKVLAGEHGINLAGAVMAAGQSWPTPTVNNSKNNAGPSQFRRMSNGKPRALDLNCAVVVYPTPLKSDHRRRGPGSQQQGLPEAVRQEQIGSLNPDWVELLMGWPLRWSSLEPINPKDMDIWLSHVDNPWEDDWERNVPRVTTVKEQRVDRLKAIGNGQVPLAAATAFLILSQRLEDGV